LTCHPQPENTATTGGGNSLTAERRFFLPEEKAFWKSSILTGLFPSKNAEFSKKKHRKQKQDWKKARQTQISVVK
jgi:hypothetical protein